MGLLAAPGWSVNTFHNFSDLINNDSGQHRCNKAVDLSETGRRDLEYVGGRFITYG